ncbi:unnamed protein product, partial [Rotaria sordida]
KIIPQRIKSSITTACAEFAALDGRAFETMSGKGFLNLAQQLFDAGRVLGISYCGIALSHVDSNYRRYTFILGCYPYDGKSHSAANVRAFVDSKLADYNLTLDSSKKIVAHMRRSHKQQQLSK